MNSAARQHAYRRRLTRPVSIGDVVVGGRNPLRVQSMTTPATTDVPATVAQIAALVEAGCEIVRVTVPSRADAESLPEIRAGLRRLKLSVPLVADIHFTPAAALLAVEHVEKVRINPGNYADRKKFAQREYSDVEYQAELERIAERFKPLVLRAKERGVALRIGTNHGSLSDRIMNRYGDSAEGMVESALEFVRIAEAYGHRELVLSMKSSNPLVCIQAYRLLVARMDREAMAYPLHLGVTEAGDGEDGRVKSALGIGALLEEGLGDTVRVSLTEDPVAEIPVALALVAPYNGLLSEAIWSDASSHPVSTDRSPGTRRRAVEVLVGSQTYGGARPPVVELRTSLHGCDPDALGTWLSGLSGPRLERPAEIVELRLECPEDLESLARLKKLIDSGGLELPLAVRLEPGGSASIALNTLNGLVARITAWPDPGLEAQAWLAELDRIAAGVKQARAVYLASARLDDVPLFMRHAADWPIEAPAWVVRQGVESARRQAVPALAGLEALPRLVCVPAMRKLASELDAAALDVPLVIAVDPLRLGGDATIDPSVVLGTLLADGLADGLAIAGSGSLERERELAWSLLQAARLRISRAEFISCPSCGRTLFDLETTTQRIKARTSHLKGVKIAIMGCIVNGPGEMADADFGYVGWGPGVVSLFVGKEMVVKDIPQAEADDRLIELIKQHGRWLELPGLS